MGKRSRRPVSGRMVSASDLAQMGRRERLVVLISMEAGVRPSSNKPGHAGWSSTGSLSGLSRSQM